MPPEDDGNTQGVTGEPSGDPKPQATAGSSSAQSAAVFEGKTAEEWAKTYKGLQNAYQKLQNETSVRIAELEAQIGDSQTKIEELGMGGKSKDDQLNILNERIATLTQQVQTLTGEKTQAEQKVARQSFVLSEFPELAPWEAKGLLPQADNEEQLKEVLSVFRQTLSSNVGAGVKQTFSGATPAGTGATSTSTKNQNVGDEQYWYDKMIENAGRDQKAFLEAQKHYDEIIASKQNQ